MWTSFGLRKWLALCQTAAKTDLQQLGVGLTHAGTVLLPRDLGREIAHADADTLDRAWSRMHLQSSWRRRKYTLGTGVY